MIVRKPRLFLVKYTSEKMLASAYVYTNSEESAKEIVKESNNKYNDKHFFYEEININEVEEKLFSGNFIFIYKNKIFYKMLL